jgi:hypothetical protein
MAVRVALGLVALDCALLSYQILTRISFFPSGPCERFVLPRSLLLSGGGANTDHPLCLPGVLHRTRGVLGVSVTRTPQIIADHGLTFVARSPCIHPWMSRRLRRDR